MSSVSRGGCHRAEECAVVSVRGARCALSAAVFTTWAPLQWAPVAGVPGLALWVSAPRAGSDRSPPRRMAHRRARSGGRQLKRGRVPLHPRRASSADRISRTVSVRASNLSLSGLVRCRMYPPADPIRTASCRARAGSRVAAPNYRYPRPRRAENLTISESSLRGTGLSGTGKTGRARGTETADQGRGGHGSTERRADRDQMLPTARVTPHRVSSDVREPVLPCRGATLPSIQLELAATTPAVAHKRERLSLCARGAARRPRASSSVAKNTSRPWISRSRVQPSCRPLCATP